MNKKMNGFEMGVYYAMCFLTLGAPWFWKVIVKKALIELED